MFFMPRGGSEHALTVDKHTPQVYNIVNALVRVKYVYVASKYEKNMSYFL